MISQVDAYTRPLRARVYRAKRIRHKSEGHVTETVCARETTTDDDEKQTTLLAPWACMAEPSQFTGTIPKQNIKKKVQFEPHPFENSPRKKERMILQKKRDEERRALLQKFPNIEAERTLFIQPQVIPRAPKPKQTYSDEDFIFPTPNDDSKDPNTDPIFPTYPTYTKITLTH
ncbi:ribosome production factor 1-like [Trichogramma pretiosum]|uniref:ribosome production factor 1-like n=1 Tax=Trichogramma pretiosum TaxID=7493 RepID=UPI000C71C821|nr:ribosome production factor 1-like [Trichogramma pretiosum]